MMLTSFARDAKTDNKALKLITVVHGGKKTLK